jgi:hypothetical protein
MDASVGLSAPTQLRAFRWMVRASTNLEKTDLIACFF